MDTLTNEIIESINKIDDVIMESKINVLEKIDQLYQKSNMIMEYCEDVNDLDKFDIFEESSSVFLEDAPAAVAGLSYLKFDNTHIISAIKHFNAARAKFGKNDSKVSMIKLAHTDEFKAGVKDLETQFQCKILMSSIAGVFFGSATIPTPILHFKKITISKSKGFQLNGMPMLIFIGGSDHEKKLIWSSPETFGQSITAIILHEIWHNISIALHMKSSQIVAATETIVNCPKKMTGKQRRVMITNYVETLVKYMDIKCDKKKKKKMIKLLSTMTCVKLDKKALNKLKGDKEEFKDVDIDMKYIEETLRRSANIGANTKQTNIFMIIAQIFSIIITIMGKNIDLKSRISMTASALMNIITYGKRSKRLFGNEKDLEEYNADLFAAMYQLPVSFKHILKKNAITPNEMSKKTLEVSSKLRKVSQTLMYDVHPGNDERNYASLQVAKNMLNSGVELDPEIRKYLEWIVNNFSSLDDMKLDEMYDDKLFNPEEANQLDDHLNKIIQSKRVVVTEYDIEFINSDDIIIEG